MTSKPISMPHAYELADMYLRRQDMYAHAKYEILLGWLAGFEDSVPSILNVGCGSGELCMLLAGGDVVTGRDNSFARQKELVQSALRSARFNLIRCDCSTRPCWRLRWADQIPSFSLSPWMASPI